MKLASKFPASALGLVVSGGAALLVMAAVPAQASVPRGIVTGRACCGWPNFNRLNSWNLNSNARPERTVVINRLRVNNVAISDSDQRESVGPIVNRSDNTMSNNPVSSSAASSAAGGGGGGGGGGAD